MSRDHVGAGRAWRATLQHVAQDSELTAAQRLVGSVVAGQLVSYSRLADQVRVADLMALTGLGQRTVQDAVQALVGRGHFDRHHVNGAHGGATFQFRHLEGEPPQGVAGVPQRGGAGVGVRDGAGVGAPDPRSGAHPTPAAGRGGPPQPPAPSVEISVKNPLVAAAGGDFNEGENLNDQNPTSDQLPPELVAALERWRTTTGQWLTPSVVAQVAVAWQQDAGGTAYCLQQAAERWGISSRPGLLLTMLRKGDHHAGAPGPSRSQQAAERWGNYGDPTGDLEPIVPMLPCQRCDTTGLVDAADGSGLLQCPDCGGEGQLPITGGDG